MSPYNCIEKPLKTSSYKANIKNLIGLSVMVAGIFCFIGIIRNSAAVFSFSHLMITLATPIVILILMTLFVIILRARENMNLAAFYQYFHYFNRFLDKAVSTMPDYVDFEVFDNNRDTYKNLRDSNS